MATSMLNAGLFNGRSLCVVGNLNRDIKIPGLRPGEHLFRDGETTVASVMETIGGGGANSACAAACLGAKVALLAKVGADSLGHRLERTLKRHGIRVRLARDRKYPTGTSLALMFEHGKRHFLSCLAASRSLTFKDFDLSVLSAYEHLLRADVWFSEPMLFGGNERLFRAAHHAGLAISLDLNWDPEWGHASRKQIQTRKAAVQAVLRWVNLAHGNAHELQEFTDTSSLAAALKRLRQWGVEAVVVHLGAKGAGYYDGRLTVVPAAPVKSVVNTTGTGDVLSVCMMLLHRRTDIPIAERLRLSNAAVGSFIQGERQFIPTLTDAVGDCPMPGFGSL